MAAGESAMPEWAAHPEGSSYLPADREVRRLAARVA